MASKPGPLTDWPWKKLGSFKYLLLAPLVARAIHENLLGGREADNFTLAVLVLVPLRYLVGQLWITVSRFQNAGSKHQIQSKSIQFEQVDREGTWDDNIIFYALFMASLQYILPALSNMPLWNSKGVIIIFVIHAGPSEFVYYWLHRALHHHFLYTRYHSHHHSSFVTEPITAVVHPFAEHLMYAAIFAIAPLAAIFTQYKSICGILFYILWFDFMNFMGHCNFEFIPKWAFQIFPPLKYLMYTPSFHSLHHSQVHTNFSLFMPLYDYIYGTVDKFTDSLYEDKWQGSNEKLDFAYLTHATSLLSIFHLRLGFASFAAMPYSSKWYMWILWPISNAIMLFLWIFGRTFTAEKNRLKQLHMQTWVIPRYTFQYFLPSEKPRINQTIERSILDAEEKGVKVLTLGLLNKVMMDSKEHFQMIKTAIPANVQHNLVHCTTYHTENNCHIWVVGRWLSAKDQMKAPKGTHFVQFLPFPIPQGRKDCTYESTPAMRVPKNMENVHACENWLPRGVMSAWRVGGMVHALEGWDHHECAGDPYSLDPATIDKVWDSALKHGFFPLNT
eukprot:Gb_13823 [translate_table: standard]